MPFAEIFRLCGNLSTSIQINKVKMFISAHFSIFVDITTKKGNFLLDFRRIHLFKEFFLTSRKFFYIINNRNLIICLIFKKKLLLSLRFTHFFCKNFLSQKYSMAENFGLFAGFWIAFKAILWANLEANYAHKMTLFIWLLYHNFVLHTNINKGIIAKFYAAE